MHQDSKRSKHEDSRTIFGGILDESTLKILYKMMSKGFFDKISGPIKSGKESTILLAEKDGKKLAVKVYAIDAANFKKIIPYLEGDKRFGKIKSDKRSVMFEWCKKEFKNLERANSAGVSCPKTIAFLSNVLIMEFIGDENAYPRLKDAEIKEPQKVFEDIISDIKKLYKDANIVHGDLSEYNILFGDKHYLIDFSQAVLTSHPRAEEFLKRDISKICNYFKKLGVESDPEAIYRGITGE